MVKKNCKLIKVLRSLIKEKQRYEACNDYKLEIRCERGASHRMWWKLVLLHYMNLEFKILYEIKHHVSFFVNLRIFFETKRSSTSMAEKQYCKCNSTD